MSTVNIIRISVTKADKSNFDDVDVDAISSSLEGYRADPKYVSYEEKEPFAFDLMVYSTNPIYAEVGLCKYYLCEEFEEEECEEYNNRINVACDRDMRLADSVAKELNGRFNGKYIFEAEEECA